jgi:hypothetical protein
VLPLVWSSQIEGCSCCDELTGALMARRTFDVPNVTEILVHWDAGRSRSEIADSLGLDRKTVKKYLGPVIEAGIEPGSGRTQAEWSVLVREWFPQLADTRLRQVSWPLIEPHRDYIVEQLEAGVTKATIHQRLRDERGLQASVASVKRWIAANLPEQALRSKVTAPATSQPGSSCSRATGTPLRRFITRPPWRHHRINTRSRGRLPRKQRVLLTHNASSCAGDPLRDRAVLR